MNLYQDVTEIVDVTADVDTEIIPALFLAETTVVYGLSFSLFSVADAAEIHGVVMDVAEMTVVSGSSFSLSSVADVETIMDVDVTEMVAQIAKIFNSIFTYFKKGG